MGFSDNEQIAAMPPRPYEPKVYLVCPSCGDARIAVDRSGEYVTKSGWEHRHKSIPLKRFDVDFVARWYCSNSGRQADCERSVSFQVLQHGRVVGCDIFYLAINTPDDIDEVHNAETAKKYFDLIVARDDAVAAFRALPLAEQEGHLKKTIPFKSEKTAVHELMKKKDFEENNFIYTPPKSKHFITKRGGSGFKKPFDDPENVPF